MHHQELSDWLRDRLTRPLPGLEAQMKMASLNRELKLKNFRVPDNARHSAVLVLLYPDEAQQVYLPMQERTAYKGVHSRQIGLPGGGVEEVDQDYEDTALRETHEEIGVPPGEIELLGRLSMIYIPPSNYLVQPVVGMVKKRPEFTLDPVEVKSLLEAPLHTFTGADAVQTATVRGRNQEPLEVPCFRVEGRVVWGATAMIMSEFREILAESGR